ncbi:MAG: GTPase Era [Ilumatobacteraceae bacterium]|jgi:GTPase|nr:GTPase Era [Ilumatobacteraceae bacterium]MBJ7369239.1 GTPase Era [Ilumatobacteraceae bacterium]MBJ7487780.1 GTPase Era [Ilumatobacteraceae bacterium]
MRSGFVTFVGRPNVGKSTLLNAICGEKVSIVSNKPQTTRTRVRGVWNRGETQIVFVDTPGIHKPVSALGERVNATAIESVSDVDVVCLLIDATEPFGRGDKWVADRIDIAKAFVIVNKTDRTTPAKVMAQLAAAGALGAAEYFPISAKTGAGIDVLLTKLAAQMPEGPQYFPDGMTTDTPEAQWVAELVREQLLHVLEDELPYSIATRVTEWEWPLVKCEIIVERDSQKGMVIGKGGELLKKVGIAARAQMPEGAFLELKVVVDKNWQRNAGKVQRLGY